MRPLRILVVDNYDSFVYNLVQYLGELGAEILVKRNDELSLGDVERISPDGVLISPGPGRPESAGISCALIQEFGPRLPIFGVCLGHQAIGHVYGAKVVRAPEILHGKTSDIYHQGEGLLAGLPVPFAATRYHSLVVERASLPRPLKITAETREGLIMGLAHRELPVEGVQFHPESVLTQEGKIILSNFLRRCEGWGGLRP